MGGFLLIYRAIHSPFGQVLKAIRENEPRAVSLGYSADRYKLLAFVLSAALSGLAGATKAIVFQLASLTDVHWTMSGEVVLMTLLGGLGTVFGPVVGALVIVTMENYLAQFGAWVTIAQGAIFVVCVLTFRRGIVGELAARLVRAPLAGNGGGSGRSRAMTGIYDEPKIDCHNHVFDPRGFRTSPTRSTAPPVRRSRPLRSSARSRCLRGAVRTRRRSDLRLRRRTAGASSTRLRPAAGGARASRWCRSMPGGSSSSG